MINKDFTTLEERIGVNFKNKDLLTQAFLHRSYLNENRDIKLSHNERLEFLGDAVLELISTDFLYKKYRDKTEGELTALRAALVNTNTLSGAAQELGMNDYLLLARGEAKDTGRARQYILANTYESLIGAMYLDLGYDTAARFINETLLVKTDEIEKNKLWQDAKSLFQEKAQEVNGVTPSYKVLGEEGPDHDKYFTVGIFIEDEKVSEGKGHSKQEAEQEAARAGLVAKGWTN